MINEIIALYKERSGDNCEDLNEKQLTHLANLAYEYGHYSCIEECVSFMYDFVSLARDVLAAK